MAHRKNEQTNTSDVVYQRLKKGIERGRWKVGERLPTIEEIEQGESNPPSREKISDLKSTRHNARIAFKRLAQEGFVEARGKAGTVVIKLSSAMDRPRLVALITPSPSEFVSKLATAITDALQSRSFGRDVDKRYRLICANAGGSIAVELQLLEQLAQEADAIVVLPTPANDDNERKDRKERVEALWRIQKPIWLIAARIDDGPLRYSGEVIAYPESTIATRVTEFVRDLKPRPTRVFVAGEDFLEALRQRAVGIVHGLTKNLNLDVTALSPPPDFLGCPEALGEFFAGEVVKRTKALGLGKPVLVLCTTDLVAFGVLNGFRKIKPRVIVPDDAMVMGVDDHEFAKYCNPQLTSLPLKPEVLGQTVVERIVAKLEGQTELLPADLNPAIGMEVIPRESTGGKIL